eukprot:4371549-Alexandrium_andersonii.AAC.1
MGAVADSPAPATVTTAPRSTFTNHSRSCPRTILSGPATKSATSWARAGPAASMNSLAAQGSK